jgi:hypothetical protein
MVSDVAKALIQLILTSDPGLHLIDILQFQFYDFNIEKRPKIDEIFNHDFFRVVLMNGPEPQELRQFKIQCLAFFQQREQQLLTQQNNQNKGFCLLRIPLNLLTDYVENIPLPKSQILAPTTNQSQGPKMSLQNAKKSSVFLITYQNLSKYLDAVLNKEFVPSEPPIGKGTFYFSFLYQSRSS